MSDLFPGAAAACRGRAQRIDLRVLEEYRALVGEWAGASKGLGLAIAKYLLRESHKLVLVARSAGPLEKLKEEYPGQVEYVAGDLGDFSVCASSLN